MAGNIKAAGISAGRETDLRFYYNTELEKLTGGDPSKATPAMKAQAMQTAANALRGDAAAKVATGQEQAITARLDKDERLQGYYGQLNLLNMKKNPTPADVKKMEDLESKISAREQQIKRDVMRQPQQTTDTSGGAGAGAGRMKYDAQGNQIS